jgi:hypothetical protein
MSVYLAKFFKRVLSDDGHEYRSLQSSFEVNARDRAEAERISIRRLCEVEHISRWSQHADELVIEEADFPS